VPIKGGYLLAAGGGALLLWSGFRGRNWSTSLRDLISGKPLPTSQSNPIISSPNAGSSTSNVGLNVPIGAISKGKNVALGKALAASRYGWVGQQFTDLNSLWTKESGWNNRAQNPNSGAYGIPQALPPSKMGALANPPTSSAFVQILWGLKYIKQRYGSPSAAWAHEVANNWY
jgi:resuscitation-promoting factor RpfB